MLWVFGLGKNLLVKSRPGHCGLFHNISLTRFSSFFFKLRQVTSEELGSSLQDVNMLVKKNKTLKSEIENHEPRINFVRNNGQKLIDENNSQSEEFEQQIADLQEKLAHLKENLEARNVKLLMSEKVQQFFFDANEAEAWMSEQGNYKIDNLN